jgi:hypothetical protein
MNDQRPRLRRIVHCVGTGLLDLVEIGTLLIGLAMLGAIAVGWSVLSKG